MCAGPSRVGRRDSRQRKGYGDAPRAAPRLRWGAADGRKYLDADEISRGVQGSSGPLVGGRRIETAGPLVLSVMKEQHSNEKYVKRWPLSYTRQVSCKATPAKANKEKSSVSGTGGCGVSRGVSNAGKPASQFWQRERMGKARGCPESGWSRQARWADKEKSIVRSGEERGAGKPPQIRAAAP